MKRKILKKDLKIRSRHKAISSIDAKHYPAIHDRMKTRQVQEYIWRRLRDDNPSLSAWVMIHDVLDA